LWAKPKQAGKKERCGGNSAVPERNQIVDSAVLLESAGHHKKILFSLEERGIRRAQNEKNKEYFSVVWRAERAVAGLASLVGVLLKECSNFVQKTPMTTFFIERPRCLWMKECNSEKVLSY